MWSLYAVPAGKEEGGRTEGVMEVILPVRVERTMVAGVSLLLMTAREEARTVISEGEVVEVGCGSASPEGGCELVECGAMLPECTRCRVSRQTDEYEGVFRFNAEMSYETKESRRVCEDAAMRERRSNERQSEDLPKFLGV